MKLIHVLIGKADPNAMGGINKVVHHLSTSQLLLGYEVEVWGITETPRQIHHQHTYKLTLFPKMKNRFTVNKELVKSLDSVSNDTVFHLHSSFRPEIYAVSRHLKKRNLEWVLTPHGGYTLISLKKNYWFKKVYRYLFEDRIINGAFAIQSLGERVETVQFSDKVGVVPNGYELSDTYKKYYSKSGALDLCFCGRLDIYYKGLDLLFEALVLLRERKVDVTLNLIGGGADREFLQNMATENNLDHTVTFSGIKIGEEKDHLIQQSDIFILTSRSEGLPTAVLEAASMALPLIITLPTNMGECVENASAGYVIPEMTAESISKAIQVAASQKKLGILEQKGKVAREMIKNSFTWLKIAKLMENNIYSKIDKNYRESD